MDSTVGTLGKATNTLGQLDTEDRPKSPEEGILSCTSDPLHKSDASGPSVSKIKILEQCKQDGSAGTTNSSPTDPAYIPDSSGQGGRLVTPVSLTRTKARTPTRQVCRQGQSFFDSDSDSDPEEAVVCRASSVRMYHPSVVHQGLGVGDQTVYTPGATLDAHKDPETPAKQQLSDIPEFTTISNQSNEEEQINGGPSEALQVLQGEAGSNRRLNLHSDAIDHSVSTISTLSEKSRRGGLFLNPVTEAEKTKIQRTISAPPLPYKEILNRKVKIRPSDLIVEHSRDSKRLFREKVVTTPYPTDDDKYKEDACELGLNEKLTAASKTSSTAKSTRFEDDRFPSPDRPEVLFLDLGLARHPSATMTLEIKIADKGIYDDEMLFRQIRTAYQSRLLGISRSLFCLIRGVAYATISSAVQYDFRTTEFMRLFNNPRLGHKRKTWVIWLRHHSRQDSPARSDHLHIVKRPLSASLRTAEKRLSISSDSTSVFNFSFLPPLSIPRIPFLSKGSNTPSSASTFHSPPSVGLEGGCGTIKVDLHHEFSFWILAFVCSWVLFLSVASVVLWTIFGVPGAKPGDASAMGRLNGLTWDMAAQTRLSTGLLLGMMVAMLGSMTELCLIAGAYILL